MKILQKVSKKVLALVLAFAMVLTGLYVIAPEAEEVKAQSSESTEVPTEMLGIKMQAKRNDNDTETEEDDTMDLRIISSVDSLDYQEVGFYVWFGDDAKTPTETNRTARFRTWTVLERIQATSKVSYNFSPKVIDTCSEYFVTGTIMSIANGKWGENFYIEAYCVTQDGETKTGVGRYFNVNDAMATDIVNIPVQMDEVAAGTTLDDVTLAGTETTATVEAYLNGYAHLNVAVPGSDKTKLDSASKIVVGSAEDSPYAIYRNLETDYTGSNADTSWYKVYEAEGETEFVIATDADLYGFSSLSQSNNFSDATIYVIADIDANDGKGTASSDTFTRSDETTPYDWTPIGGTNTDTYAFAGTFDGQMHEISGLYISKTATAISAWGFMGQTGDCTVQNMTLANSCFDVTCKAYNYPAHLGSVAGQTSGRIDTVKVTETVYVNHTYKNGESTTKMSTTGGIVGLVTGTSGKRTISNCWFAGKVFGRHAVGGILGRAYNVSSMMMEQCLNSGTVVMNVAGQGQGGLCGEAYVATMTIKDSLNIGTYDYSTYSLASTTTNGAIVGYARSVYDSTVDTYVVTLSNVYANNDANWLSYASTTSTGKISLEDVSQSGYGAIKAYAAEIDRYVDSSQYTGQSGYINMNLDFAIGDVKEGSWSTTAEGTPVLSSFVDAENTLALDEVATARTLWYTEADTDTTEYTLYTMADMFGFASLTDETFEGKTVKLGADITINKGTADATCGFVLDSEEAELLSWTPRDMAGTFDGNGHSIEGVYLNTTAGNVGLFTTVTGKVQNLALLNSYVQSTNTEANNYESKNYLYGVGSIAGSLSGTLDTVYSDAIVVKSGAYAGGLVGTVYDAAEDATGTSTITNSCFAGQVQATQAVGGLVGLIIDTVVMEHCLNTGSVTGDNLIGGLCAYVWTGGDLTIKDSLNVGRASSSSITWSGSMVGYVRGVTATLNNTFGVLWFTQGDLAGTGNWRQTLYRSSGATVTFDGVASSQQNDSTNSKTELAVIEHRVDLTFYDEGLDSSSDGETKTCWWVARDGKIPMLESFEDLLTNVTY